MIHSLVKNLRPVTLIIIAVALALSMVLTFGLKSSAAPQSTDWLSGDQGVIIVDTSDGSILYQHNANVKMAPASLTKLMTALLVAEKDNLSSTVTVGKEVAGIQGSVIGLKPGDKITVEELLNGLLVHSGNDAATALAAYTSGSVANFVSAMNKKSRELGLSSTNFNNPNGLPIANHYSTARDISLLALQDIKNPIVRSIVTKREATLTWKRSNGKQYTEKLTNTNAFLGVYPGVNGMKTGTTTEAGQCLVTYATWDARQIIVVILKSKNRYLDTLHVLDNTFQNSQLNRADGLLIDQRGINF